MSIKGKLNRSLGLENELVIPVANNDAFDEVGTIVDAIMPDGTPTPESDVVELEIVYKDAFTTKDDLEELIEASTGIETVCLAMAYDQRTGGLTEQSSRYAAIALESIGRRFNVTSRDMGMPSLESFGNNRAGASTISLEGIIDTLKSWWDVIVKKFKQLLAKLNKYYQESWSGAARMKARAEALKAKSRKVGSGIEQRNIEDASLYNALNIRGKVVSPTELVAAYNKVSVPVKSPLQTEKVEAVLDQIFGDLKWDNLNAGAADYVSKIKNMITIPPGKLDSSFKINDTVPARGALKGIGGLPGNKVVVWGFNISDADADTISSLSKFVFQMSDDDKDFKTPSNKPKLQTMTASEVESVCDAVIIAMDTAIRNKSDGSKYVKLAKKVEDRGTTFMREAPTDVEAAKSATASSLMSSMVRIAQEATTGNVQVLRYSMRTSKAMLSYAAKSLGNFKKT